MQIKFFRIPVVAPEDATAELNAFLRGHKVLSVERHFCADSVGYWAVAVEYAEGGHAATARPAQRNEPKVRDSLSGAQLERFDLYRKRRHDAAKALNVPAFAIFTDREMATLAGLEVLTAESAAHVKGVSPARLRQYLHVLMGVPQGQAAAVQTPSADAPGGPVDGAGG